MSYEQLIIIEKATTARWLEVIQWLIANDTAISVIR